MATNGFTPVQRRILELLSDGARHSYRELFQCLGDPDGAEVDYGGATLSLQVAVSNIRAKLPRGQAIICEAAGYKKFYRHVRLLGSPGE